MSQKDNHRAPLVRQSPSAKIAIPIIFFMVMVGFLLKVNGYTSGAVAPHSNVQLTISRDQAAQVYDSMDWRSGSPQSIDITTWMTENGTYEQVYDKVSHSIRLYRSDYSENNFLVSAKLKKGFTPRFWQLTDKDNVVRLYLLDDGGWKQALVYPADPETKLIDRP